jgi:hypothetical protein
MNIVALFVMPFVMQSVQWRTGAASSALHSTCPGSCKSFVARERE